MLLMSRRHPKGLATTEPPLKLPIEGDNPTLGDSGICVKKNHLTIPESLLLWGADESLSSGCIPNIALPSRDAHLAHRLFSVLLSRPLEAVSTARGR